MPPKQIITEELPGGSRRITHPSGHVIVETIADRKAQRRSLKEARTEAQQRLIDFETDAPPEVLED